MRTERLAAVAGVCSLFFGFASASHAKSLADKLNVFLNDNTLIIAEGAEIANPYTQIIQREAIRGLDFPAPPSSPGFTYTYNPELQTFERSTGSLGPEFAERAQTAGRNRVTLGFSYLYANLRDEAGRNFAKKIGSSFFCGPGDPNCETVEGVTVAGVFVGDHFSLMTHVFSFSGTYGITDRWDVNLLVPLLYSVLSLEGTSIGLVENAAFIAHPSFEESTFGVGDILLRTKYRLNEGDGPLFAAALSLRLPSGNEDDFQGLGDTTVTPSLIATLPLGQHELHGSAGLELNADDLERTRARYDLGTVIQATDRFGLLVDVIGSSSFVDDEFTVSTTGKLRPFFDPAFQNTAFIKSVSADRFVAFVPRSDLVDVSVGFKVNLFSTAVGYVGAIVPLTKDGLRADVIPAGAFEYTF
jgi:hypothetical protein